MLTPQDKEYIRRNPEGLSRNKLAERFGVTPGVIAGLKRVRSTKEVDLEKRPAEVEFVRDNTERLADWQIVEALRRVTGDPVSVWWVRRVRYKLAELAAEKLAREMQQSELPPASGRTSLSFGDL